MSVFAWWIYFGGVFAQPSRKIGFMRRFFWPIYLGEYVAKFAFMEAKE